MSNQQKQPIDLAFKMMTDLVTGKKKPIQKQESEIRIYLIDSFNSEKHYSEMTNEEFVEEAEANGNIYSLGGFEEAFNEENVNTDWFMRILMLHEDGTFTTVKKEL